METFQTFQNIETDATNGVTVNDIDIDIIADRVRPTQPSYDMLKNPINIVVNGHNKLSYLLSSLYDPNVKGGLYSKSIHC